MVEELRRLAVASAEGDRLPSTRALAARLGVGPVTLQRAVQRLVAEGLVESRPGSGNFVARRRRPRVADLAWQATALGPGGAPGDGVGSGMARIAPGAIALNEGYPAAELLPESLVRTALVRAARDPESLMRAAPADGVPELRAAFARELSRHGGDAFAAHEVVIASGGQNAIATAMRALAAPGDVVVMESPSYWGAIAAAREAGLRIAPIARTAGGIDPADLDAALRTHDARLFYAQPVFANPTGAVWSPATRAAVFDVLRDRKAFLVEDDWARDLAVGEAPPPLAAHDVDGHVVGIRSITKSTSPSLRIAALTARGPALDRLRRSRWIGELYVPRVLQHAALEVLTAPAWPQHVRRLGRELGLRRDRLAESIERHAPSLAMTALPAGGVGLWVRLPEGLRPDDVAARALFGGVAVSPGDEWFPAEPDAGYLRLSFAAADPDRFDEAARVLGAIVEPASEAELDGAGTA